MMSLAGERTVLGRNLFYILLMLLPFFLSAGMELPVLLKHTFFLRQPGAGRLMNLLILIDGARLAG